KSQQMIAPHPQKNQSKKTIYIFMPNAGFPYTHPLQIKGEARGARRALGVSSKIHKGQSMAGVWFWGAPAAPDR
ncbi:MAG: hypothetical protein ACRCU9_00645, partial [Iodobacter sp.]